jgi:hypothetical protein
MGLKSRQKRTRWLERRAAIRAGLAHAAAGDKLASAYLAGARQRWPVFFKQVEAEFTQQADTPAIVNAPKGGAA